MPANAVHAFGPASLSNLGPGFDTLGLCLEGIGDTVSAWRVPGAGLTLRVVGADAGAISTDPQENTAGVAALETMQRAGIDGGVVLVIRKGFSPGSGIGSSAASAVAAAWAVNLLAGEPLPKPALVEAVLAGEAVASGARHGDNVLPALFGGLVLVSSQDPTVYRPVPCPDDLRVAIVFPEMEVLTRQARAMLPVTVPLRVAVDQASALGFMIDAFRSGDWAAVGRWMMQDGLAEPVRAAMVPCYRQIKAAALEAGAYGCAMTGSGPAMFAISDCDVTARHILDAMIDACSRAGVRAKGHLSRINLHGVETRSAETLVQ